jgi:uncharacterized protein
VPYAAFILLCFRAAWGGHASCARHLIEHGIKLDQVDTQEGTPLHYCSKKGFRELAEMLVQAGAAVEQPNNRGMTALHSKYTAVFVSAE